MEVPLARGIFTRRYNEGRRKPLQEAMIKQGSTVYQLCKFKYDQTIYPKSGDVRKISAACPRCLPTAINEFDEDLKALGIQNCFDVETMNSDQPFYIRWMPLLSYIWKKASTSAHLKQNVHPQEIMQDPELFNDARVGCKVGMKEDKAIIEKWNKLADQIAREITISRTNGSYRSWHDVLFMRVLGWLWGRLLESIFKAVCVHQGEIELLQRAHDTGHPIVYIPINRSFMDPFIFNWTLVHSGLPIPYFFTSSSFWFLTKYLGGLGTYSKCNADIDPDEKLIRTYVFSSYIRTLFKKSASIQLYLEPCRSRSGKPLPELYSTELLEILNNLLLSKKIDDAFIVPVSVSYEKLPEDCCNDFDAVQCKSNWPVLKVVNKIVKCIRKGLGLVRVDYGQPFSLREFRSSITKEAKFVAVTNSGSNEAYARAFELSELRWDPKHGSAASIPSLYGEMDFIGGSDKDEEYLLSILANHIIYAGLFSTTIMSTHIIAFLLLKKFRYGTTLECLIEEVRTIKKLLEKRGRDVGFTGDVSFAVLRALESLGPEYIQIVSENEKTCMKSLRVKPVLEYQSLRRLGYYANNIMSILAMESVVAVAIFALIGHQLNLSLGFDLDIRINDKDLSHHSRQVYEVFTTEFFLHPPCLTAEVAIRNTFESLSDVNLLHFLMDETIKRSRRQYGGDFDYESDEGDNPGPVVQGTAGGENRFIPYEYKVVSTEETFEELSFLRKLLVPYLEVYGSVSTELQCLLHTYEIEEGVLRQQILQKIKTTFSESEYGELLTMEVIKMALLAFENCGVIYCDVDKTTKVRKIFLQKKFNNLLALRELSNNIMRYVTWA